MQHEGKDRRVEPFMRNLLETLEVCVRQSAFVSDRIGRMGWNDVRKLYHRRRWNDHAWWHVESSKLEVGDEHVSDLAAKLEPVLGEFRHTETGRIGNGLFLLMGGAGTWACPTFFDFAKLLIPGAVKLGAGRVIDLLQGWASGEPLRFRLSALLEGAGIDAPMQLGEGIYVHELPTSSSDLPASLPSIGTGATVTDYVGGVVLSVDCEMSPALYVPTEEEVGGLSSRRGVFQLASDRIPNMSFDSFCESISLACNGFVDWFVQWRDYDDLAAFAFGQLSVSYKYRSGLGGTKFTQDHLNAARQIHRARHAGGKPRENLELAMRRWIRSKRPGTDLDKLIELRIALEALYEIGGLNEKGFRIATYGAWHLGKDFEERREYRDTLRKVYDDSSRAVHAGKLKHAAKNPELISSAQVICREGILKRLEEAERPRWDEIILGEGA